MRDMKKLFSVIFFCSLALSEIKSEEIQADPEVSKKSVLSVEELNFPNVQLDSRKGDRFTAQVQEVDRYPEGLSYGRFLVSVDQQPSAFFLMEGYKSLLFLNGDNFYAVEGGQILHQQDINWSIVADDQHLGGNALYLELADELEKTFVAIDVNRSLRGILGDATVSVENSALLARTKLTSSDGTDIEIVERSPNDTLVLGCKLALFKARDGDKQYEVSCITKHPDKFGCDSQFQFAPNAILKVVRIPEVSSDATNTDLDLGFDLWSSIHRSHDYMKNKKLDVLLPIFNGDASRARTPYTIKFSSTIDELRIVAEDLFLVDSDTQTSTLPIDDVRMRWSKVEQKFGPRWNVFNLNIIHSHLARNVSDVDENLSLLDSYVDLGLPAFLTNPEYVKTDHSELYRAIFLARHRQPWTVEHVRICLEFLPQMAAESGGALALVKTLILMDKIAELPETRVEHWYQSQIVNGSQYEQLDGLRQLTLVPTGRNWLRERLARDQRDSVEVKRLGCSALRQRAEATLQTKQWDFMSQAECDQSLTLIQQIEAHLPQAAE